MNRLIDLSHPLEPGMPAYPGLPVPQFRTWMTHAESAERGAYSPGTTFQIAVYELAGNTGTYMDAPFHRHPGQPDLAALPLTSLANLPGIAVDARHAGPIGPEAFAERAVEGRAVLVRTDWSRRWGNDGYFQSGPFLTADTCHYLVGRHAALVGIDCANIDDMRDGARPAHTTLLAAGIPIVEHLCALDALPADGFRFFAVPPAVVGGTSFAVRAFALLE